MKYEIINKRKKELGLTNSAIAEMTGITLSTLDKITSGANQNPKFDTLQAIANAIGCTLDDFSEIDRKPSLSAEAISIAQKYDRLDTHAQRIVRLMITAEMDRLEEND